MIENFISNLRSNIQQINAVLTELAELEKTPPMIKDIFTAPEFPDRYYISSQYEQYIRKRRAIPANELQNIIVNMKHILDCQTRRLVIAEEILQGKRVTSTDKEFLLQLPAANRFDEIVNASTENEEQPSSCSGPQLMR